MARAYLTKENEIILYITDGIPYEVDSFMRTEGIAEYREPAHVHSGKSGRAYLKQVELDLPEGGTTSAAIFADSEGHVLIEDDYAHGPAYYSYMSEQEHPEKPGYRLKGIVKKTRGTKLKTTMPFRITPRSTGFSIVFSQDYADNRPKIKEMLGDAYREEDFDDSYIITGQASSDTSYKWIDSLTPVVKL